MSLNDKINKVKITLFGNTWIARIAKWILYSSVVLVAWLISKSENLFPGKKVGPWVVLKNTMKWEDRSLEEWLNGFFALSFFALLVFAYFWILSIFVEWLTKIEISPHQQIKIIEKKSYELDEKLSYKIEKVNSLKVTVFRGSSYVSLTGNLLLSNGKQKKTIDFVCRSHSSIINPYLSPNSLETYLPQTKLKFKQKYFFTWQKIVGIIILVAGSGFLHQVYKDGGRYKDRKLGVVVKSKGAIQEQIEAEEKAKSEEEERQKKLKEAGVTDPRDIKGGFKYIGGLEDIKKQCENNAEAILARNNNPKSLEEPKHMLLYGPPGTGKTFLAQAMAKRSGSFFLNRSGKDFKTPVSQIVGNKEGESSEDKVKRIFDIAIQLAKGKTIVALIDEIDQMGGWEPAGNELLSILSGATSDRYKNIVIIATTNKIYHLAGPLLRSQRIGRKLLVNYPGPKDLRDITRKVASEFYEETKEKEGGYEALGSRSKSAFVNEFSKLVYEEMVKDNYAITTKDIYGEDLPEKIKPNDKKTLFTGADVKAIFLEMLTVMKTWGQKTLKKEQIAEAVKRIYTDNKITPMWYEFAREYVKEEYRNVLDQEDMRKIDDKRRGGGPGRIPR
jgi:SpoVK/Ycf46/Vps4 family AAA+-type ATPase